MWLQCSEKNNHLLYIDLSSFDTSKVRNMYGIFSFCGSLTSIILTSFKTYLLTSFGYFLEGLIDIMYEHLP